MAMTFVLLFCIKGFLEFQAYCKVKGYYVFEVNSLIWLAAWFFFVFVRLFFYTGQQIQPLPLHETKDSPSHQRQVPRRGKGQEDQVYSETIV
jgi:hypothetical protein